MVKEAAIVGFTSFFDRIEASCRCLLLSEANEVVVILVEIVLFDFSSMFFFILCDLDILMVVESLICTF